MNQPRGRYFEDFELHEVLLSPTRRISLEDLRDFGRLTGDNNPLHIDPEYAKSTPFGDVIGHGALGLSLALGLFEQEYLFHGTGVALLNIARWDFRKPFRVGDEVRARMTIRGLRRSRSDPSLGIVQRGFELLTGDRTLVQDGESSILVRARSQLGPL